MKRALFLFGVVGLLMVFSAGLAMAAPVGKVTLAEGKLNVLKTTKAVATPVSLGDPVDVGDIYRAKSNSRMEITFTNGNILRIAPGSRVEIREHMVAGNRSATVARLHRGRVQAVSSADFIRRVAAFAEGNKFEVHTLNAVAGIRGSNMLVSLDRGATMVIFVTGNGYLYNPTRPDAVVSITAGNVSFVTSPTATPTPPRLAGNAQIQNVLQQFAPGAPEQAPAPAVPLVLADAPRAGLLGAEGPVQPQVGEVNLNDIRDTPQPKPPEPPAPPPGPVNPPVTYTGPITSGAAPTGGFYSPYPFTPSGSITGTVSGSIDQGRSEGTMTMRGAFQNPNTESIWSTGFEGTSSTGGGYVGYAGGSWSSWRGGLAAIYLEGDRVGYLLGDVAGTHGVADFSGSGDLGYSPVPMYVTTLTPNPGETRLDALKRVVVEDPAMNVESAYRTMGTATFGPSYSRIQVLRLPSDYLSGATLGVVRELQSGTNFANPGHQDVSGIFGTADPNHRFYMLGPATLEDDGQGHITLFEEPIYIDRLYAGTQAMKLEGVYDGMGNYRMSGAGLTLRTPLAFGSPVTGATYQALQAPGTLHSLMGGVASLYGGGAAGAHIIGAYTGSEGRVWASNTFYSTNYATDPVTFTTYDATPGAFAGFMGGLMGFDGTMTAHLAGISVSPQNVIELLSSDLTGNLYPGLAMFELAGDIARTPAPSQAPGVTAANFANHVRAFTLSPVSAGGAFAAGGAITGSGDGLTLALDTLPWGIYRVVLSGGYAGSTGDVWSAFQGGPGTFGRYLKADSSQVDDEGYWIGGIAGSTWSGNLITGLLYGDFVTHTKMGLSLLGEGILGNLTGNYPGSAANTWQAVSVGTWIGHDLAFVSDMAGGTYRATDSVGGYASTGLLSGLAGSDASLAGAGAAPHFLGIGPMTTAVTGIWQTEPLWSKNYRNTPITYTTYDASPGAFVALLGGRDLLNAPLNRLDLTGGLTGIYLEPAGAGYVASYMTGSGIIGTAYPAIQLVEVEGDIVKSAPPSQPSGVTAANFRDRIQTGAMDGAGAYMTGSFTGAGAGTITGREGTGTTLALTTMPWGVYGFNAFGGYTANTSDNWAARIGGNGIFGSFQKTDLSVADDNGYWIADMNGGQWSSNSIAGSLSGTFLTRTKMGVAGMTGEIFGSYNAGNTFQLVSLGKWEGTPITYSAGLTTPLTDFSDMNDGSLTGLAGHTETLWTATQANPADIKVMGSYGAGTGTLHIWGNERVGDDNFYTYNAVDDNQSTYDDGVFKGYLKGRRVGANLEGLLTALYIDPAGNAGFLKGSLSGAVEPGMRMFTMDGTLYPTRMAVGIGIAPADLWSNRWFGNAGTVQVAGSIGTGHLEGSSTFHTQAIANMTTIEAQPWGIYEFKIANGLYANPVGAAWSGRAGGYSDSFGARVYTGGASPAFFTNPGYWTADIVNGTWTGNGLAADLEGRFISQTTMGSLSGNILGVYDGTSQWLAVSAGVWEGAPLLFGETLLTMPRYFDGTALVNAGSLMAQLGGTTSLWAAWAPVSVIGEYSTGMMPNSIWTDTFASYNALTGAPVTYDGGAYTGTHAGIIMWNNATGRDDFRSKIVALYIDPGQGAGYLAGSLSGYGMEGTFALDGTITRTEKVAAIGVAPEDLGANLRSKTENPATGNHRVGGSFTDGLGGRSGSITGAYSIQTNSITDYTHNVAEPWGIFSGEFGGTLTNPNTRGAWEAKSGGRAYAGAYNLDTMMGGQYNYANSGYYGYNYYNDPSGKANAAYVGYRNANAGVGFDSRYGADGKIYYTNYTFDGTTWHFDGFSQGTWDTGRPVAPQIQAAAPGGWQSFSGERKGRSDWAFVLNDLSGTFDTTTGKIEGTVGGVYIGQARMGTLAGDILGSTANGVTGNWQAVALGTWEGEPLAYRSGFSIVPQYAVDTPGYFPATMPGDGFMNGALAGTTSIFGPGPVVLTVLGEYEPGAQSRHIWIDRHTSYSYLTGTNTTADGGAYSGALGGVTIRDGAGLDAMEGRLLALYIDPAGHAGILNGILTGTGFPDAMAFAMGGIAVKTEKTPAIGLTGADLTSSIFTRYGLPEQDNYFVKGSFNNGMGSTAGDLSGRFDIRSLSLNNYGTDTPEPWGIFYSRLGGTYTNPAGYENWSVTMGGKLAFGAYNLATQMNGSYAYADNGYFSYNYHTDSLAGKANAGWASLRRVGAGWNTGFDARFSMDGHIYYTNYAYDGSGWHFTNYNVPGGYPGTWNPAEPVAPQMQALAPAGGTFSGETPGRSDASLFLLTGAGTVDPATGALDGTVAGRYIGNTRMGTLEGELLGADPGVSGTWQAVALGSWEGTPLAYRTGISFMPWYYTAGGGMTSEGWLNGAFGGTTALTDGAAVPVTMIGEYVKGGNAPYVWNQLTASYNYIDQTNTTYNGGAYRGYFAGTLVPGAAGANDDFEARFIALYIAPNQDNGYVFGTMAGQGYPAVRMFEMDGTMETNIMGAGLGIAPQALGSNIWSRWDSPGTGTHRVSGAFTAPGQADSGSITGSSRTDWLALANMTTNQSADWGIFSQRLWGWAGNPDNRTSFRYGDGGRGSFGSFNLGTASGGQYVYNNDGYYTYGYYNDLTAKDVAGWTRYRRADAGTGYDARYMPDGTIEYTHYTYSAGTWHFTSFSEGNWNAGQPIGPQMQAAAPGGWTSSSSGKGLTDTGFFMMTTDGTMAADGKLTGTSAGDFISRTRMGTLDGEAIGAVMAGGTWAMENLGVWFGDPLMHRSGFATETAYFDPNIPGFVEDGFINAALGHTTSFFDAGTRSFTMIGEYETGMRPAQLFLDNIVSFNFLTGTNTTVDGGAYMGTLAGVALSNNAMEALLNGLYIDPSGNAGTFTGSMSGTRYPGIQMFRMDGGVDLVERATAAQVGNLPPSALTSNIWLGEEASFLNNHFAKGAYNAGDDIAGRFEFRSGSIVNGTALIAQPWGIWAADIGAVSDNPGGAWSMMAGGRGYFGAHSMNTMRAGKYEYDAADGYGFYGYSYYTNLAGKAVAGNVSYRRADQGFGFEATYQPNGTISYTKLSYDANGWHFAGYGVPVGYPSTWDTGQPLGPQMQDNAPVGYDYFSGEHAGKSDFAFLFANASGTVDPDGKVSGTMGGEYIGQARMGTFDGNLLGVTDDVGGTGSFAAAALGAWTGTPLAYRTGFNFQPSYYDLGGAHPEGWVNGVFAGTTPLTQGVAVPVRMLGEYERGSSAPYLWMREINSFNVPAGTNTTYNGGAYRGFMAGNLVPDAVTGNDNLSMRIAGLYIDPAQQAGYIIGGVYGEGYPDIRMVRADGTIATWITDPALGIAPENLQANIWRREEKPTTENILVKGAFDDGHGHLSGTITANSDFDAMSFANFTTNTATTWGIFSNGVRGTFSNPSNDTLWSAMIGGRAVFGAYNLATMSGGQYTGYPSGGYYRYSYYNNLAGTDVAGFASYRGAAQGIGYDARYDMSGTIYYTNYTYGAQGWRFAGETTGAWDTGQPVGAQMQAAAPAGYTTATTGKGKTDYGYYLLNSSGDLNADGSVTGSSNGWYMGQVRMGGLQTDVLGVWTPGGALAAEQLGIWSGTPLMHRAGFQTEPAYFNPAIPDFVSDGFMSAALGHTTSFFGAAPRILTMIGRYEPGAGPSQLFQDWIYSFNYGTGTFTTADGGAYKGSLGGVTINNTMDALIGGIYMDPTGNAGVFSGTLSGTRYPDIEMFTMDGSIDSRTQMATAAQVGNLLPGDMVMSAWHNDENHNTNNLIVSGAFGPGVGNLSGGFGLTTLSIVNGDASIAQPWGVFSAMLGGTFTNPGETTWSAGLGGKGAFGRYNMATMESARYDYGNNGYYGYSYFTGSLAGKRLAGVTAYRRPDLGVGFDANYYTDGTIGYTKYTYAAGVWRFDGSAGPPGGFPTNWNTGNPIGPQMDGVAPGGGTFAGLYPGKNDSVNYLADLSGNIDPVTGKITGQVSGTYIGQARMGTFGGDVLGSTTTPGANAGGWQAVGLGVWEGDPIQFRSGMGNRPQTTDGSGNLTLDGYMGGPLAGTTSLFGATNPVDALSIGTYETENGNKGHIWHAPTSSLNLLNGKNTTYEATPGAYYAFAGGNALAIPDSVNDRIKGILYGVYVDPAGNLGFLSSDLTGLGYNDLLMYGLEGEIARYGIKGGGGITADTFVNNLSISGQINATIGAGTSEGYFFSSADMTVNGGMPYRGDHLWFAGVPGTGLGAWRMESYGTYLAPSDSFMLHSEPRIFNAGSGEKEDAYDFFILGGPWADNEVSGIVTGIFARWAAGGTRILAGETRGFYADSDHTFAAFSAGVSLSTQDYLTIVTNPLDARKAYLTELGFATEQVTTAVTVSGAAGAGPTIAANNLMAFRIEPARLPAGVPDAFWTLASSSVTGAYTGQTTLPSALAPVAFNNLTDPNHPIYGVFGMNTAKLNPGTGTYNWLADAWGLGVFPTAGSYVMGYFGAYGAGSYNNGPPYAVWGDMAGTLMPVVFLSRLEDPAGGAAARLRQWGPHDWFTDDVTMSGLFGPNGPFVPTTGWEMGVTALGTLSAMPNYPSHIFSAEVSAYDFVTGQPLATDGGAAWGYITGAHIKNPVGAPVPPDSMVGMINMIYIDANGKAGLLTGMLGDDAESSVYSAANKVFCADGTLWPVEMENAGIPPVNLQANLQSLSVVGSVCDGCPSIPFRLNGVEYVLAGDPYEFRYDNLIGKGWGIWQSFLGRSLAGVPAPGDAWTGTIDYYDGTAGLAVGQNFTGTKWSDNRIVATTTGYGAQAAAGGTPKTWISVGETRGTIDATVNNAFMMASGGTWIETNKYLQMAATEQSKLQQLNIPSVQVGVANLSGAGNNLTVNMNNVKFFSTMAGTKPSIWATNSITGTYSAAPVLGTAVNVSGGGLSAQFTPKTWNAGNWMSTVTNGAGNLSGGSYTGPVTFRGAAAGTFGGGSLTGTGAGVAK